MKRPVPEKLFDVPGMSFINLYDKMIMIVLAPRHTAEQVFHWLICMLCPWLYLTCVLALRYIPIGYFIYTTWLVR